MSNVEVRWNLGKSSFLDTVCNLVDRLVNNPEIAHIAEIAALARESVSLVVALW